MSNHDPDNSNSRRKRTEPTTNGLRAFETLWRFLEEDGWHPQRLDDRYVYHVQFSGKNGQQNGYAALRPDLEQLIFYTVAPVNVPDEGRGAVAEFITRANYGLRIGNFEMDYADGEVRYKSSIDFEGVELVPHTIMVTVYPAVQTMDHYMPGLMRVIYGGLTPFEAIQEIEQRDD